MKRRVLFEKFIKVDVKDVLEAVMEHEATAKATHAVARDAVEIFFRQAVLAFLDEERELAEAEDIFLSLFILLVHSTDVTVGDGGKRGDNGGLVFRVRLHKKRSFS